MVHLELPKNYAHKKINYLDIITIGCEHFKMSLDELKQKTRRREVVYPRQVLMTLMRENTDLSYKQIGDLFGNRDHTTVIHSLNTINDLRFSDPTVKDEVNYLQVRLSLVKPV